MRRRRRRRNGGGQLAATLIGSTVGGVLTLLGAGVINGGQPMGLASSFIASTIGTVAGGAAGYYLTA